ncbi:MAG: septum formation initiator family protein [Flavobacteriaceae bacterium]|jgi:cell division protein FtsB|nr:septum formation initiator family protein [Flavobacteriaceae bacterium]
MVKNEKISSGEKTLKKSWYWGIYTVLTAIFIVWMLFFDTNSYLTHRELNQEIAKFKDEKEYYKNKFDAEFIQYNSLKNNKETRETYARENYFFKKNNEDIFIVVSQDTLSQNTQKQQNTESQK